MAGSTMHSAGSKARLDTRHGTGWLPPFNQEPKTTQAQVVVVSPGMGRCLEKIDDRHLRFSTKSDEGQPLHDIMQT